MLLDLVAERGWVEITGVSAEVGVSAATVRRDLDYLAEQRLVTRVRRGALARADGHDVPPHFRARRHMDRKRRIGCAAARLVAPGGTIVLNGGTTVTEVAKALTALPDPGRGGAITVVTNAIDVAGVLAARPWITLVVAGGTARTQSYELVTSVSEAVVRDLRVDVAILGVDAIDPDSGPASHHEAAASVNRLLADRAGKVVVVADSSKLSARAASVIGPVTMVDTLVTDTDADPATVRRFHDRGVDIRQA
ncbi:DeoR/GlpR family DNA-binding transcription regulator [Actinokineospora sp. HUAS TT18]|uniref:DeoR/GlpR family DNA-binding transcription regulator n=1 Tax=Actinokineospora sp. HUAS TT18 TaxID=3447451 RepID=UPI003F52209B